jgi:hypothetical protein
MATLLFTLAAAAAAEAQWVSTSVGGATPPGSVTGAGGSFTVQGGGSGIGGTADSFFFAHQAVPAASGGTYRIRARLASLPSGKAGVMVRVSTAAGERHYAVTVAPGAGTRFEYRPDADGESAYAQGSALAVPRWVQILVKQGGVVGFESADGSTWTLLGGDLFEFDGTARIGLAVTSQNPGATVSASFDNVAIENNPADQAPTAGLIPAGAGTGVAGDYWSLPDASFAGPPPFPSTGPDLSRTDATVDFFGDGTWSGLEGSPVNGDDNTFAVRWSGSIVPRVSGDMTFFVQSDDGVRLWIDGQLLVDAWTIPSPFQYWGWQRFGTINLQGGKSYSLVLEYFENTNRAISSLRWVSHNQPFEVVPATQLIPTTSPPGGGTPPWGTPPGGFPPPTSGGGIGGGGNPGGGGGGGGGSLREGVNGDNEALNDKCSCSIGGAGSTGWAWLGLAALLPFTLRRGR